MKAAFGIHSDPYFILDATTLASASRKEAWRRGDIIMETRRREAAGGGLSRWGLQREVVSQPRLHTWSFGGEWD